MEVTASTHSLFEELGRALGGPHLPGPAQHPTQPHASKTRSGHQRRRRRHASLSIKVGDTASGQCESSDEDERRGRRGSVQSTHSNASYGSAVSQASRVSGASRASRSSRASQASRSSRASRASRSSRASRISRASRSSRASRISRNSSTHLTGEDVSSNLLVSPAAVASKVTALRTPTRTSKRRFRAPLPKQRSTQTAAPPPPLVRLHGMVH